MGWRRVVKFLQDGRSSSLPGHLPFGELWPRGMSPKIKNWKIDNTLTVASIVRQTWLDSHGQCVVWETARLPPKSENRYPGNTLDGVWQTGWTATDHVWSEKQAAACSVTASVVNYLRWWRSAWGDIRQSGQLMYLLLLLLPYTLKIILHVRITNLKNPTKRIWRSDKINNYNGNYYSFNEWHKISYYAFFLLVSQTTKNPCQKKNIKLAVPQWFHAPGLFAGAIGLFGSNWWLDSRVPYT